MSRKMVLEQLGERALLAADLAAMDVSGDGLISAVDVLQVVNHINQRGGYDQRLDVNVDGSVSPVDLLQIVNTINSGVRNVPQEPLNSPTDGGSEGGDFVEMAVDSLADRLGISPSAITVTLAEETVWPNGAMGLPIGDDELVTQAIVDGFHVILTVGEDVYDYRFDRNSGYMKIS